jgi:hypothetical protein
VPQLYGEASKTIRKRRRRHRPPVVPSRARTQYLSARALRPQPASAPERHSLARSRGDGRLLAHDAGAATGGPPLYPRLAGVHEAAELLGLTKQRLSQLARDPTFPAALALLHSGPVWDLSDLEAEAARRRQRRALALRA